ncbi:hypothetical protein [Nocardia brasiliensis]|uniref:hypothetical protein n=1 Tax=Nocardia brasiliensis TaxID=37326 RepID=UPI00366E2C3F
MSLSDADRAVTGCGWNCGDETVGHHHYTVVVRNYGRLLGRLSPTGHTVHRKVHAAILSRATAELLAQRINDEPDEVTATVRRF